MISSGIAAQIALAFGEGKPLQLFYALRTELVGVFRKLCAANAVTHVAVAAEAEHQFEDVIDPMRRAFERRLLRKSNPSTWLLDWSVGHKRRNERSN